MLYAYLANCSSGYLLPVPGKFMVRVMMPNWCSSLADVIHFHPSYPRSSTFIHFHPFSFSFIHFHPLSWSGWWCQSDAGKLGWRHRHSSNLFSCLSNQSSPPLCERDDEQGRFSCKNKSQQIWRHKHEVICRFITFYELKLLCMWIHIISKLKNFDLINQRQTNIEILYDKNIHLYHIYIWLYLFLYNYIVIFIWMNFVTFLHSDLKLDQFYGCIYFLK